MKTCRLMLTLNTCETFNSYLPIRIHVQQGNFRLPQNCLIKRITKVDHMIKFCVKLQDNVIETFNKLIKAYEDQVLSREQFFNWHSSFWMSERLWKKNPCFGWLVASQRCKFDEIDDTHYNWSAFDEKNWLVKN